MRTSTVAAASVVLAVAACSPQPSTQQPGNDIQAPVAVTRQTAAPLAETGKPPAAAKTRLGELKVPIDPKSVEGAGQVVQLFGAFLETGQFAEAAAQWSDATAGLAFAQQFKGTTHMEIGNPTPAEGAAGSIYTTMAVSFYGDGFRRPAEIILRRVNDVPGSTERQRPWHIERVEWRPAL